MNEIQTKVISIASGYARRRNGGSTAGRGRKVNSMPVSRAYIAPFAATNNSEFQAFTALANFCDALEQAIGVRIGANGSSSVPPPPPAQWTISAANGHYLVQITNPNGSSQAPIQHQIASSTDVNFDAQGSTTTYSLGVGETSRDIVDPGVTKYWRIQSRHPGSTWNGWRLYSTSTGVTALSSGALKTS